MAFSQTHFLSPLRIAIGGLIALVGLSACETSSLYENRYARYYDACDQRAGICYANCSDFAEGESKTQCQNSCTTQVDQCFADISARIQSDNDQRYAYTPAPYYGAYGYYRPGYGYYYGPYDAPYGYYSQRRRTYPYYYSGRDYGYYDPRYDYYNRRYYDRRRGDGGNGRPDYGNGDNGGSDNNNNDDRFYNGKVVRPGVADRQSEIDNRQSSSPVPDRRTFSAPSVPDTRSNSSNPPQKVTKPGTRPKNDD